MGVTPETKKCPGCKQVLPDTSFRLTYNKKLSRYYLAGRCFNCTATAEQARDRTGYAANYGLQAGQYEGMLLKQKGVCAICEGIETMQKAGGKGVRRLAVDHCHKTGRIRELLCSNCNRGLGSFNDDPELLRKAADYLERHRDGK